MSGAPALRTQTWTTRAPTSARVGVHVYARVGPHGCTTVHAPVVTSSRYHWYSSGAVPPDAEAVQVIGASAGSGNVWVDVTVTALTDCAATSNQPALIH